MCRDPEKSDGAVLTERPAQKTNNQRRSQYVPAKKKIFFFTVIAP